MKVSSLKLAKLGILAGGFLAAYDGSAVAMALPAIMETYDAHVSAAQWVVVAFLAVTTALLIPAGSLADRWGRRRVYAWGLRLLAVGALGSAFAPNLGSLVGWRTMQGVGAAAVTASTQAILTTRATVGPSTALGQLHAAIGLGLLAGPVLGGWLLDEVGWPAIFLAELIFVVTILWMISRETAEARYPATRSFDFAGTLLLAGATGPLIVAIALVGRMRETFGLAVTLAGIGLASTLGLLAWERRTPSPLFPTGLFSNRAFTLGLACAFLTFVAMASNMFLMPILLQTVLRLSSTWTGIILATAPVVIILSAPFAGGWADRIGPRLPASLGLATVTGGIALMREIEPGSILSLIVGALAVYGTGAALFQSPNNSAVLAAVPARDRGMASGILATARNLGLAIGVAIAVLALSWQGPGPQAMSPDAFRRAFGVLMTVAAFATGLSWLRGTPSKGEDDAS
ncbi:MAG: MFS transporter [Candidatus Methylomirabilales bacterium]